MAEFESSEHDGMALKGTYNSRKFVVIRRQIGLNSYYYEGYVEVKEVAKIPRSVIENISVYGGCRYQGPINFKGRLFDDRKYLGFSLASEGISEMSNYGLALSEVKRMAKQVDRLAKEQKIKKISGEKGGWKMTNQVVPWERISDGKLWHGKYKFFNYMEVKNANEVKQWVINQERMKNETEKEWVL